MQPQVSLSSESRFTRQGDAVDRLIHVDGLRAVAVLSVLLFHLGFTSFAGGFVGVDVFLVISGYVITRMIVNDIQAGQFKFARFYTGRAKRLVPAFLVTIALCGIAAFIIMTPEHVRDLSWSTIAALLTYSNIFFWMQTGYFDAASHAKPLLHTWTLSVEWQFYYVWPFIIAFFLNFSRNIVLRMLIGVAFVSLVAMLVFRDNADFVFFWMPFRIYEFAIGAVLLWLPKVTSRSACEALFGAGLVLIALAVFGYQTMGISAAVNSAVAAAGAGLAIYAGGGAFVGRVISNPVATWLGRVSYSTYLVHWPLIVFTSYIIFRPLEATEKIGLGFASVIFGAALYYSVELPFWKGRASRSQHAPAVLVGSFVALVAASVLAADNGWRWRIDADSLALADDPAQFRTDSFGGAGFEVNRLVKLGDGAPQFILVGDSHAAHLAHGLSTILKQAGKGAIGLFDHGCFIAPNLTRYGTTANDATQCFDEYDRLRSAALGNKLPIILAYSWQTYSSLLTEEPGGASIKFVSESDYAKFLFTKINEIRADIGLDRRMVLFGTVPGSGELGSAADCIMRPMLAKSICSRHLNFPRDRGRGLRFNQRVERFAVAKRIGYLDPYDRFCADGRCRAIIDGKLMYSDAGHLSKDGSIFAAGMIFDKVTGKLIAGEN